MIPVNELRVGNWVDHYFPDESDESVTDRMYEQIEVSDLSDDEYLSSCFPIQITREILEKFGFDKEGYLYIGDRWLLYKSGVLSICGRDACTSGHCFDVNIEYLHQLQNICFDLSKTEFPINL